MVVIFLPLGVDSQHHAGVDRLAFQQDCASAAGAAVADAFGSGQVERIAQRVQQGDAGFELRRQLLAIDHECDRSFARPVDRNIFAGGANHGWPKRQRYRDSHTRNLDEIAPRKSRVLIRFRRVFVLHPASTMLIRSDTHSGCEYNSAGTYVAGRVGQNAWT